MTLKEYLTTANFETTKVITWNVAGNKAVRHNLKIAKLTDNVYVGEIDNADNYYYVNCCLCAFYNNIAFDIGHIYSETDVDDIVNKINNSNYVNADTFMESVYNRISNGLWINLVEMEYIKTVNPEILPDVEKARATWQKKLNDKRNVEQNTRNAEKRKEMEKTNAKSLDIVNSAINTIKNGGTVDNDYITIYSDIDTYKEYSVIAYLFDKYGITMPIRTKGFVINRVASVTVSEDGKGVSYSYYKKGNSKGSSTIYDYIYKLIDAVRND